MSSSRLEHHDRITDIFAGAMRLPASRRGEFLDSTCADEPELRREIEALLASAERAASVFDVASQQIIEPDPQTIGPYELLEPIGEGGMAVVYKAQQHRPVRRVVAVKLVKLGMDTRRFVARFESERQALAMMDHPNVAQVYDAGSTETGRPYFVMEYVPGESILKWCDARKLSVCERLKLFIPVCEAVEHAHRKGIIHRDLKDSNVLVMEVDGKPVPKVIDFGVAKAISERLTESTIFTEQGQIIGTPGYMSPEQAERGALDIDTRTDVYSLGVLLYELIAGVQPIPSEAWSSAGYEKVLEIIRETEPARPTTRLNTLSGDEAERIAECRNATTQSLCRQLSSELEWIPLKAMRKDREQRYRSPSELADDIRNYLDGRPLIAGPESGWYRARKFLHRHKTGVAAAAAMILLLLGGIATTAWQAVRANREAGAAQKQASIARSVNELMTGMIRKANRGQQKGDPNVSVRAVMDAAAAELKAGTTAHEPQVEAALCSAIGATYVELGLYDAAIPVLRRGMEREIAAGSAESLDVARSRVDLATALFRKGDSTEAESLFLQVLATHHEPHKYVASALNGLGALLWSRKDYDAAEPLFRQGLAMRRTLLGSEHKEVASSLNNVAAVLADKGDLDAAEPFYREALAMRRKLHGDESIEVAETLSNLGNLLLTRKDYPAAESAMREALAVQEKLLGEEHPSVAMSLNNLGVILDEKREYDAAEALYRRALAIRRKIYGDGHPRVLETNNNLASLLFGKGDYRAAEPVFRDDLAMKRKSLGDDHPDVLLSMQNLAGVLRRMQDYSPAETLLRDALQRSRRVSGDDHANTLAMLRSLGRVVSEQGRFSEADPLFLELYQRAQHTQLQPRLAAEYASYYGICLVRLGRYHDAEQPLHHAYDMLCAADMQKHAQTRAVVAALAEMCNHTSRPTEAAKWRVTLTQLEAATQSAPAPR